MKEKTFVPPSPLKTAVLFLVFNRPNTTKKVFEAIRKAKPPRLYVAADGFRTSREGEAEKVAEVRKISTSVDWDCEVKTLFRDQNLGCKRSVSGGITWFFENEEQGIILEDDCLPSQSFFWFCEYMLQKYKKNKKIYLISGYNKQQEWNNHLYDYFFSNLGGIWGWASWKNRWENYDIKMSDLEILINEGFFERLLGKKLGRIRQKSLLEAKKRIMNGELDTWDYQWGYTRHKNSALACVPSVSLISNIGFGPDATHTKISDNIEVNCKELSFPLRDNFEIIPDDLYDVKFLKKNRRSLINKLLNSLIKRWR